MSTIDAAVVEWAVAQLPDSAVTTAAVAGHAVVRLENASRCWFAKQAESAESWAHEVQSYRRWSPSLSGRVATLVASEESLRALLLTALPGSPVPPADWTDPVVHERAGLLLRRLHQVPLEGNERQLRLFRRAMTVLPSLSGVLTAPQTAFIRDCVNRLERMPERVWVACHGDYAPWNWQDLGTELGVVDFGHSGQGPPGLDMTRLLVFCWWDRPDLMTAFLRGYGRMLSGREKRYLYLSAAPLLARDIRHLLDRRNLTGVEVKLAQLRALLDGFRPQMPDPQHRPAAAVGAIIDRAEWTYLRLISLRRSHTG
jgi:hypothetical protein